MGTPTYFLFPHLLMITPKGYKKSYKGYRIEVSVWLDGDGWLADLSIYYSRDAQNILVTFAMPGAFKTYDRAVEESLAAAQKWIDQRS